MSSIGELQKDVDNFISKYNLESPTNIRLLDLVSELGELAKVQLKGTNYGRWDYHDDIFPNWMDEMGDVLFSLMALANIQNIDLEDCLKRSIEKYQKRLDSYGDAGSKRNRPVK